MCEIQLVKKLGKRRLEEKDLEEFYKLMCFGSFSNADAFGFFNSREYFKKTGRFNSSKFNKSSLTKDDFIVGHNRLAYGEGSDPIDWKFWKASNDSYKLKTENHHPFIIDNLVMVHNGVLYNTIKLREKFNIQSSIQTDSFVMLWLIDHYMRKSAHKDRRNKILDGIQKALKKIVGSYSIFLYDKKTGMLLYFKNFQTEFAFYKFNDTLVGTTNSINAKFVYFGRKKERIDFDEDKIYEITSDIKKPLVEVATFSRILKNKKSHLSPIDRAINMVLFPVEYWLRDRVYNYNLKGGKIKW